MRVTLSSNEEVIKVVKRMFFLAYQASAPVGLGILQVAHDVDEDRVWHEVRESGCMAYGDYVFGRMVKFGCRWEGSTITIPDKLFLPDYQSFCGTYKDNESLLLAALESLGIDKFTIDE